MQKRVKQRVILKSLLWGIFYLGISFPSFADTQETVDMAAVERAIEASKGYQGKVSCGKIDMGNKRYTFRIPEIYQWNFGIEYFGDSPWTKGGIAKKEDPCLYDIKNAMMSFFWPSMKPYSGEYLYNRSDLKTHPNLVTASLSRSSMQKSSFTAFKAVNKMLSFKQQVIGYQGSETDIDSDTIEDTEVLAMGKYLPDLGLYHYTFEKYIEPYTFEKKKGITKKRHNKREIFWSLDQGRAIDLIVCEYLGLDVTKMIIKDTVCKLNTTIYEYGISGLQIRYGGEYMRDWKNIRAATIQQYKAFITEAVLP